MNLADIAVLVEAAQAGSLAAAARRLGITPMAASRRLAALEAEVGVRLMHRTTRSTALTVEGEEFLPFAQAMLENEADGMSVIQPTKAGVSGLLRITASAAFGRKMMMPMLPGFMAENPQIKVDLLLSDTIVDLAAQGIDLAIRIAPLQDSWLIARRLAENPRALYATPAYLEANGVPRGIGDLQNHECLALTNTAHWVFHSAGTPVRIKPSGRFTASSMDGLHAACRGGLGIAMLSEWDAREEAEAGHIRKIVLGDGEPEALTIWAVYPTTRLVPPKVRAFVSALGAFLEGR